MLVCKKKKKIIALSQGSEIVQCSHPTVVIDQYTLAEPLIEKKKSNNADEIDNRQTLDI